jgi:hypothetical protein
MLELPETSSIFDLIARAGAPSLTELRLRSTQTSPEIAAGLAELVKAGYVRVDRPDLARVARSGVGAQAAFERALSDECRRSVSVAAASSSAGRIANHLEIYTNITPALRFWCLSETTMPPRHLPRGS